MFNKYKEKKILNQQTLYNQRKVPDMVRTHFHWCASNVSPLSPSNPSEQPVNFEDIRESDSGPSK